MPTRYVGNVGWLADWKSAQTAVVRLDENLGRVEDMLSRFVSNNTLNEIDSPGEDSTSLKIGKHVRLRDCKRIYWAAAGVNDVANRLASFRYCSGAGGFQWDTLSGGSLGVKMTLTTGGKLGIGTVPVNMLDVEGGAAIGATYSGTSTAPTNGLIVQGQTGIGTASPISSPATVLLDVRGRVGINTSSIHSTGVHALTVGSGTGVGAATACILCRPDASGAEATIQFWGSSTGNTAVGVGAGLPGTPSVDDLVFGTYVSPPDVWSRRASITNSAGILIVGSSTSAIPGAGQLQIHLPASSTGLNIVGTGSGGGGTAGAASLSFYQNNSSNPDHAWVFGMGQVGAYTNTNNLNIGYRAGGGAWGEVARFFAASGDMSIGTTTDYCRLGVYGHIAIGNGNELRFYKTGSTSVYTGISASASQSSAFSYVLPSAQGAANTLMLNDGAGTLSWATLATAGIVGGFGTAGTIPKWNTGSPSTTLTNSIMSESGSQITVAGSVLSNLTSAFTVGYAMVFPTATLSGTKTGLQISGNPTFNVGSTVRLFDMDLGSFASTGGNVSEFTGYNISAANASLNSDTMTLAKLSYDCSGVTTTTLKGLHILVGDSIGGSGFDADTIDTLIGVHVDHSYFGNGTAPTHEYGIRVDPTTSSTTDFHAGAFGGNVNLTDESWVYWGPAVSTVVGSKTGGIRYSPTNNRFEINSSYGGGWTSYLDQNFLDLVSQNLSFRSTNTHIFWGGAGVIADSTLNIFGAEGGSGGTAYKKIILGKSYTNQFGFDVDMSIVNGQRIYWATTPQTVVGSRSAAFYWNSGSTKFDFEVGTTVEYSMSSTTFTIGEGNNIVLGTTTGTKVGTGPTQKLAFWAATPIIQPANTVDIVTLLGTTGLQETGKGFILPYVAKTGTYGIAATDNTINCTSGTFTATLPTAVGCTGQTYNIKNSGSGVITLATTSSQTIDGVTSKTLNQYDSYTVMSDGANWIIL